MTEPATPSPARWRRLRDRVLHWVPAHRDGRLLLLLLFVTVMSAVFLTALQVQTTNTRRTEHRFEREIIANCVAVNTANKAFNGVLDQQIRNVENSTAITPEQRAQAIALYEKVHLPITVCPH